MRANGASVDEVGSFEKAIVCLFQNIQRTSFLASSDISFFKFVANEPIISSNNFRLTMTQSLNNSEIAPYREVKLVIENYGGEDLPAQS